MNHQSRSILHLSNGVYKPCKAVKNACPLSDGVNHLVFTENEALEVNELLIEQEAGGIFNQGLSEEKEALLEKNLKTGSDRFYWVEEARYRQKEIEEYNQHRARFVDTHYASQSYYNYKDFQNSALAWLSKEDAERFEVFFSRLDSIHEDIESHGKTPPYKLLKEYLNEVQRLETFNFYEKYKAVRIKMNRLYCYSDEIQDELKRLRGLALSPEAEKEFAATYPIPDFEDDPKIDPVTGLTPFRNAEQLIEKNIQRAYEASVKRREEAERYARSVRGRIDEIVKFFKSF